MTDHRERAAALADFACSGDVGAIRAIGTGLAAVAHALLAVGAQEIRVETTATADWPAVAYSRSVDL